MLRSLKRAALGGVAAVALALAATPALATGAPYNNAYCTATTGSQTINKSALVGWNDADNRIWVIGGGGDGFLSATSGSGGGGGGASGISVAIGNTTLSATFTVQVGCHGCSTSTTGASWVCASTANCTSISASGVVASIRAGSSASTTSGGSGGTTTSAVGTATAGAGGSSGGATRGGGGGGGGPGLRLADQTFRAGVLPAAAATGAGADGGQGDSTFGGAGGTHPGGAGAAGTESITCTAGDADLIGVTIGGGGGGAGGNPSGTISGGNGAGPGSGGGGTGNNSGTAGLGMNGIAVLEWNTGGGGGGSPANTGPGGPDLTGVGLAANDNDDGRRMAVGADQ
jgi:hypothetical protein